MMIILILLFSAILGGLSAFYKVIDLIALLGLFFAYVAVSALFSFIFPEAPIISYWAPHKMIFWIFEYGPDTLATLIMWSPLVYFGNKACSEIFRSAQKIAKQSVS